MNLTTLISCAYGELRGYRRWSIRARAAANLKLSPQALRRQAQEMFDLRVREAIGRFPFYAEKVGAHRGAMPEPGEVVAPESLPVWTRELQREFFEQQQRPVDASYVHQTSGSTSMPVRFYITRASYEWRIAVSDRGYAWAGAEEGRRSVHVWAADRHKSLWARIKRGTHVRLQRRHYFDAFRQIGAAEKKQCLELINKVKPETVVGYTGTLVDLARFARDHPGLLRWKAKTLVNAAEGLYAGQRELLEEHLVDEVYLAYGTREFMLLGMECRCHRGYHVTADNVLLEVVDAQGQPVAPGENGRIVVTDFHNAATPFIRYEVGDLGTLAPPDQKCECGISLPLLASVDGRMQDVIHTPEGGTITGLYVTYTMRQFDWIEGYQVVQDTRDHIRVRLLTLAELTPERTAPVEELLRAQLGSVIRIEFERTDKLIRKASGKVRLVMSSAEASSD